MTDDALERAVFYAGDAVFREGEGGGRAYLVERGKVEISKSVDGRREVLGFIDFGGLFGEMALVDDEPRMATATAIEDTVCIVISRSDFQRRMAGADPLLRALLRIFVKNIRAQTTMRLAQGNVAPIADDGRELQLQERP